MARRCAQRRARTVRRCGGLAAVSLAVSLASVAPLALMTVPAAAEIIVLDVIMDQAQESDDVVPVAGGNGIGSVVVNTETNEISWSIIYEGLSGPAIGAHFHGPAERGEGSGIALDIGRLDDAVGPATSDTVLSGHAVLDDMQIDELLNGLWYVNLHTELNRLGEIRGQIVDE